MLLASIFKDSVTFSPNNQHHTLLVHLYLCPRRLFRKSSRFVRMIRTTTRMWRCRSSARTMEWITTWFRLPRSFIPVPTWRVLSTSQRTIMFSLLCLLPPHQVKPRLLCACSNWETFETSSLRTSTLATGMVVSKLDHSSMIFQNHASRTW